MEDEKAIVPVVNRPQIEKQKLFQYLPTAINRIVLAMDSGDEKIALGASRWIAEQCIGKPGAVISEDDAAAAGTAFAKAMREAHDLAASKPEIEAPTIEGEVRILGAVQPESSPDGILTSDAALAGIDEF